MISVNPQFPRRLGRRMTHDGAFTYRMGAGFAGDIARFPRAIVEPCYISPNTAVPLQPGLAVVVDTSVNGVRVLQSSDSALTSIYGVVVRVYPTQQTTGGMSASFGAANVPGPIVDILRFGYIMVPIVGAVTKGQAVNVWIAAASGSHIQGGFESASSGGNTITLSSTRTTFNGPADTLGIGELIFEV